MHWHGNAMTIPYHIHIGQLPPNVSYNQAYAVIEKTFREIDETLNKYNPLSEISKFNHWKEKTPFACSPKLFFLLQQCEHFYLLSNGRFDPTISPLKESWKLALMDRVLPSKEALENLPPIGWENISLYDNGSVCKSDKRVALDLGGIAKGYAVDLLVEHLADLGVTEMYVEWGGEIRVQGGHQEKRAWNIGIYSPDEEKPMRFIEINEGALATSGDYLQAWSLFTDGKELCFSHFLDPQKKAPYPASKKSVTIKHESCLVADALATVFCTLSPDEDPNDFLQEKVLPAFPKASLVFGTD